MFSTIYIICLLASAALASPVAYDNSGAIANASRIASRTSKPIGGSPSNDGGSYNDQPGGGRG
ncbi:hypothetical protein Pst134EA_017197 [Puccinia striiformis f. sp. tritici]|uniref:hypothetical protein n=1 Tax=Puccinia striiformis f. sp. tritici TaxID=168172 RepID=UPI0020073510|nr:hypothetical protein Pst134EA_017197 [Puccinia striiformis f. sp. tritici]KAH9460884.1 hypothetical protein Pst134EA_017197 [Puccinia striiformis f. sp. tritici]